MATSHAPKWSRQSHSTISAVTHIARLRLALCLWRLAAALLAVGSTMHKYQVIGSVGMRNIWRMADAIEYLANKIRRVRHEP